jgi:anti-sigma B factor antagonist
MTNFEMTRAEAGAVPVLRLKGRLTLGEGSKALRAKLTEIAAEGHKYILLDLADVTYVDSSGLGSLVAGYNSLKSKGGTVGLFQVPKRVQDLLEMSGLTAVFKIFPTEQEASAATQA